VISINEVSLSIIIQVIILLVFSSLILYFLWRNSVKKLKASLATAATQTETSPSASVEHYLATEIKLTESRFDLLYKNADHENVEVVEADLLTLRTHYLNLEKELLDTMEREDVFWTNLAKKLRRTLHDCHLVKRLKLKAASEDAEEEIKELRAVMEAQQGELENLLSGLENEDSELEQETLKEKLTTLSQSHKELSHCIAILEDENQFLRNQIKGLLDID